MPNDLTTLPKLDAPSIVGPIRQGTDVIIEGRAIPRMHCFEREHETEIILDGRLSFTFPREWAYLAACMAANAMAVGAGYSSLSAESKDRPFAPRCVQLGELPND
jgi:hypothetical protein